MVKFSFEWIFSEFIALWLVMYFRFYLFFCFLIIFYKGVSRHWDGKKESQVSWGIIHFRHRCLDAVQKQFSFPTCNTTCVTCSSLQQLCTLNYGIWNILFSFFSFFFLFFLFLFYFFYYKLKCHKRASHNLNVGVFVLFFCFF